MSKHRILLGGLLAIAAALPLAAPRSAEARVFFGVGFGFPFYAPPPVYYPPPVVYAPPLVARCLAGAYTCPLPYGKPAGAACACPGYYGRYVGGQVG